MANVGIYNGAVTAGARNGVLVSDSNPIPGGSFPVGVDQEGTPVKLAIRTIPQGYARDEATSISLIGAKADHWALAPDASGSPGAWGAWGAALTLPAISDHNTIFWGKAKATSDESSGTDDGVVFRVPDDVIAVNQPPAFVTGPIVDQVTTNSLRITAAATDPDGDALTMKYIVKTTTTPPTAGDWAAASTLSSPQTVTGLSAATTYYVFVRATDALGNSTDAAPITANTTFSDTFNRADGALTSPWTVVFGSFSVVSNVLRIVSAGTTPATPTLPGALAYVNTGDLADVAVSAKVAATSPTTNSNDGGLIARYNPATGDFYHLLYTTAGGLYLFKFVGGTFTQIAGPVAYTPAASDTLKLICAGATIKGQVNGVDKVSATDTTLSVGKAGIRWASGYPSPGKILDDFAVS